MVACKVEFGVGEKCCFTVHVGGILSEVFILMNEFILSRAPMESDPGCWIEGRWKASVDALSVG